MLHVEDVFPGRGAAGQVNLPQAVLVLGAVRLLEQGDHPKGLGAGGVVHRHGCAEVPDPGLQVLGVDLFDP